MSLKPNSTTILSMTSFGQFSRLGDMIQKGVNYKTEAKVKLSASTRAVQKKKKKSLNLWIQYEGPVKSIETTGHIGYKQ
jgi:hypothetical protein